ncbi:MAG: calcium-binding protein, partial [Isosphaeraceae bacterium]
MRNRRESRKVVLSSIRRARHFQLDLLEQRAVPAVSLLTISGTTLNYQAAAGDVNNLSVSLDSGTNSYVFEDTGTGVTIDASSIPSAVVLAPNKVAVPVDPVLIKDISASLDDLNDTAAVATGMGSVVVTINGDAGDDNITASASNSPVVLNGGDSDDTIVGSTVNDTISGNAGSDVISGATGNDSIFGNDGADFLYGNDGNDT